VNGSAYGGALPRIRKPASPHVGKIKLLPTNLTKATKLRCKCNLQS